MNNLTALGTEINLIEKLQTEVVRLRAENLKLKQDFQDLRNIKNEVIVELNSLIDRLMAVGGLVRSTPAYRVIRGASPSR